jgi:hypothetical protein
MIDSVLDTTVLLDAELGPRHYGRWLGARRQTSATAFARAEYEFVIGMLAECGREAMMNCGPGSLDQLDWGTFKAEFDLLLERHVSGTGAWGHVTQNARMFLESVYRRRTWYSTPGMFRRDAQQLMRRFRLTYGSQAVGITAQCCRWPRPLKPLAHSSCQATTRQGCSLGSVLQPCFNDERQFEEVLDQLSDARYNEGPLIAISKPRIVMAMQQQASRQGEVVRIVTGQQNLFGDLLVYLETLSIQSKVTLYSFDLAFHQVLRNARFPGSDRIQYGTQPPVRRNRTVPKSPEKCFLSSPGSRRWPGDLIDWSRSGNVVKDARVKSAVKLKVGDDLDLEIPSLKKLNYVASGSFAVMQVYQQDNYGLKRL